MIKNLTCSGLLFFAAAVAGAQGLVGISISGNTLSAGIELPGGIEADLEISFEQVVGLTATNLGASAELVDPLDLDLVSRLPDPNLVSLAGGFPVKISIEPPATGGLSFSGIASIDLHTHNLNFTADCPFRLFAAETGAPFRDITASMGMGSYRTHGTKGGFSEFLIVADLRPVASVIDDKFQRIQGTLDTHGWRIEAEVLAQLQEQLDLAAAAWYGAGDPVAAIREIEQFAAMVECAGDESVPSVWRASGDLVNVAGQLRAAAGTLRFSLNLRANAGP